MVTVKPWERRLCLRGGRSGQPELLVRSVRPGPGPGCPPIATGVCLACEPKFGLTLESPQAELIPVSR